MKIIDLIFPQTIKCFICGREIAKGGVCESCHPNLPWIEGNICIRCGGIVIGEGDVCNECAGEKFYFKKNYSLFNYVDEIQKAILSFKNGKKYLGSYFSELIREYLTSNKIECDVIIPMPVHANRLKDRGFNQSEILVEGLVDKFNIDKEILVRVKDTPHQTGLNKENRKVNLKDAFQVLDKEKIKDKVLLLIDDIYTTGTTLNESSKTLLNGGAKEVIGLSLARASFLNDKYKK